jgi:hypothetical protein
MGFSGSRPRLPDVHTWFHIAMRLQHTKLRAANLSTDDPDRVTAKAVIVAEVERLHWRIWNGKAKNAQRSIKRIRKVMHVFKGEHRQGAKGVASRKLWHALHAVDKYLRGQAAWLVKNAKRHRAGLRVGTSITEGTANFLINNRRMNKSHKWTAPSSQDVLQCFDQIACVHMSGLLMRSHMNAWPRWFPRQGFQTAERPMKGALGLSDCPGSWID